ncbi:MAG: tRNA pseudouridine(55) synthase TruB [Candidatus Omnitrophota bacterium]
MDGILLFNKPILWTSHDAVDFARRCLGQKAIGHAGTLDPLATGLLVLLIGRATKLSPGFSALDKDYAGTLTLGIRTDTQDFEGKILEEASFDAVTEDRARGVFAELCGTQLQRAPAFSAVRRKGRKSYEWARRGVPVEPSEKEITVSDFALTAFAPPDIHFRLSCSKGTYVRALCDEAGERLGCGATLSALVRTRVGPYAVEDARSIEDLEGGIDGLLGDSPPPILAFKT